MKNKRLSAYVKRTRERLKAERSEPDYRKRHEHADALRAAIRHVRARIYAGRRLPTSFRYESGRCIFGIELTSFGRVILIYPRTGEQVISSGLFAL